MAPRAFRQLARGLTRSGLGEPCTVVLSDRVLGSIPPAFTTTVLHVRGIFVRRQLPVDVENQVYVQAEPVISLVRSQLPRHPRAGDTITLNDGVTWLVIAGASDTGAGMVECPVVKLKPDPQG